MKTIGFAAFAAAVTAWAAPAAIAQNVIGNWNGSQRSWNGVSFTEVKSAVQAQGHTVMADADMTAGNLAGYDVFLIGEPMFTPSPLEIDDLAAWINGGGVMLMLSDSATNRVPMNNILSGVGSSLSYSSASAVAAPLAGGIFASEGLPWNIVGETLTVSDGQAVNGGSELSGSMARWERVGHGFVFAFGDRFDHNLLMPGINEINKKLFQNVVNPPVPAPGGLAVLLLAGLAPRRRRRH
jgi:MYXO-CTERM domain-containing protein